MAHVRVYHVVHVRVTHVAHVSVARIGARLIAVMGYGLSRFRLYSPLPHLIRIALDCPLMALRVAGTVARNLKLKP